MSGGDDARRFTIRDSVFISSFSILQVKTLPTRLVPFAQQRSSALRIRPRTSISTLLVGAALLGGCQADSFVGAPTEIPTSLHARHSTIATAPDSLWNQLLPVNSSVVASSVAIVAANDFVVPQGQTWHVTSIVLRGFLDPFLDPAFSITVGFRRNGTGQPGSEIQRFTLKPADVTPPQSTIGLHNYRLDLPEAVDFEAGTYWVESRCSAVSFECAMGLLVGQHSMGTIDGGTTWSLSPFDFGGPEISDMPFALLGTAETAATATQGLEETLAGFGLDHGTFTSLRAKLDVVLADIASGNSGGACNALADFINLTTAQVGKKLTADQATILINEATRIRGLLGC
jgi:hypothetical protein